MIMTPALKRALKAVEDEILNDCREGESDPGADVVEGLFSGFEAAVRYVTQESEAEG